MQPFSIVPLIALFLGAVADSASAAASEAPPVAMVMKIAGPTKPKLPLRAQLWEGAKVTIPPASRLTFVLFGECGLYTATGGTARFARAIGLDRGRYDRAHCGPVQQGPRLGSGRRTDGRRRRQSSLGGERRACRAATCFRHRRRRRGARDWRATRGRQFERRSLVDRDDVEGR